MSQVRRRRLTDRIGPAFIVGACIIGPGSVTLMSKTGAVYGYSMIWLSLVTGALMAGFIALFMRFGLYCDDTFLGLAAKKFGRPFAVLCGLTLASTDAAFQFGNCVGVTTGMEMLAPDVPKMLWPVLFTALAIVFMFSFKHIYKAIEKVMVVFLLLMLAAFMVNLVAAGPDIGALARGAFVPSLPHAQGSSEGIQWVTLIGLVGTTFVLVAAVFQSYVVKAKGWGEADLKDGITDTVLASVMYTLIGAVIMATAATILYRPGGGSVKVESGAALASQLGVVFGKAGPYIFGIGFFAAAFSSFITNSLVGGVLLNDGLGLGGKLDSTATKAFATLILLIGLTTSLFIIRADMQSDKPAAAEQAQEQKQDLKIKALAVGQAATMLAVPLGAFAAAFILFDRKATKGRALPWYGKAVVLLGVAALLSIAVLMYFEIRPAIEGLFGSG